MQHTHLTSLATGALKWLAGLAVVAAAVVGSAVGASAHRSAPHSPRLIEASSCGVRGSAPNNVRASTISVAVPAVALLRLDARGRVTAAATNTGCAPRQSDQVYVVQPDGSLVATTRVRVGAVHWTGDFTTPGRMQPQPVR